jgi:hypothetical protein
VDTVQWPEVGQANQYLVDDNNYEQRLEMDLPYTNNRLRAQQIAMTLMKESRESIGVVCTLKEEALAVRVGELVEVTQPTPGWVSKVFDVGALLLSPDGSVRAVLIEYEPTVYDLSAQYAQPAIPDTNLPNPMATAAPTSLVLASIGQELTQADGSFIPRIRVTWTKSNDPFVDYYEIQAKETSETHFDSWGRHPGLDVAQFFVFPVTAGVSWDVQIRAVNKLGVASIWVGDTHTPVVQDPRPQVLSITLTNAHSDTGHTDAHTDVAHGDAGHGDAHSDTVHNDHTDHDDHTDHSDGHTDWSHADATHGDAPHCDHTDHNDTAIHVDEGVGGCGSMDDSGHTDTELVDNYDHTDSPHTDLHGDTPGHADTDHIDHDDTAIHEDHTDAVDTHIDDAHDDSHSDTSHSDTTHSDGHVDQTHSDGQFGVGVTLQADQDSASVKAIARKHGDHSDGSHTDVSDPTVAEVRTAVPIDGRNVVITLLDVATGNELMLNPGDRVRVGAVAYSAAGAAGVEGPLALASIALFNIAPVGADQWVPG